MHERYIEKILNSTDNQKMYELKDVLLDTIDYIKNTDTSIYEKIECDLYEIAEGKVLNEEMAHQWVNSMKPRAKWNIDDIENFKSQYSFELPIIPAYVIMNMLYSDFCDVLGKDETEETIERYIKAAEDWYYDEDTSKTEDEKLYCYKKYIVD